MPAGKSPLLIIEALLKFPGRIIYELHNNWRADLSGWLLALALVGMAAYGVVVGSFSGGAQMWIAPAKLALGTLFSILICLPSLYIFAGLAGIDVRLRTVIGVLFAAVALSALLLIGFAPVAWIFSQSTDSVPFMGGLHLILLGDRDRFWIAFDWSDGTTAGWFSRRPDEIMESDLHPGLSANDHDPSANHRKVGPFSSWRKEVLSDPLV